MPLRVVSSSAVTGGAVQVIVPDVTSKSEAEARAELDDFTLRVRSVEASGVVGTVLVQDPAGGTIRPRRSTVTIFLVVHPTPDSADVVAALTEVKESVDDLRATVETEQAAKDRNDVVLQKLKEIKDGLSAGGGTGSSTSTSKSTTTSKSSS